VAVLGSSQNFRILPNSHSE